MNYDNFSREIKTEIEKIVNENLGDGFVFIRNVVKNNNVKIKAICIMREDDWAAPTIYLKNFYLEYKRGRSIQSICEEIFDTYIKGIENFKTDIDIDDIVNIDKVKEFIYYRIVNYEMNKELLDKVPHLKFQDLAIVFYIMVNSDENGQATALIHNQHLDSWEISVEQLRDVAFENTWDKLPPVIKKMEDIVYDMIIRDILGDEDKGNDTGEKDLLCEDTTYNNYTYNEIKGVIKEEMEKLKIENIQMYVLTNIAKINGATCITYPDVLKKFASEHDSDIYIIPSSVHEVILVPGVNWDRDEIDRMISDINKNHLDPVDILSNHVYIYRHNTDEIE